MNEYSKFLNRNDAGKLLARKLIKYKGDDNVIILALPRGGVPVGSVIAYKLHKPLDVYLVKKIGVPGHEALAMGAVSNGGEVSLDMGLIERLNISKEELNTLIDLKKIEIKEREQLLRRFQSPISLVNKIVILVDDGLATGATMLTTIKSIKKFKPTKIIVAVPVASQEAIKIVRQEADETVCLLVPRFFYSVSVWYADFQQITDDEMINLLHRASELSDDEPKKRVVI